MYLISQESISFNAPLLFLLLLDLKRTDLIPDRLLQRRNLLSDTLIEDHNVLKQVHLHLISLSIKLMNAFADFLFNNWSSAHRDG